MHCLVVKYVINLVCKVHYLVDKMRRLVGKVCHLVKCHLVKYVIW